MNRTLPVPVAKVYAYRWVDRLVSAGVDEFDNPLGPPQVVVQLRRLEVLKFTTKGYWVEDWGSRNGRRFVLASARKRFALLSEEEALESFLARKAAQIRHHAAVISRAREAMDKASRAIEGR